MTGIQCSEQLYSCIPTTGFDTCGQSPYRGERCTCANTGHLSVLSKRDTNQSNHQPGNIKLFSSFSLKGKVIRSVCQTNRPLQHEDFLLGSLHSSQFVADLSNAPVVGKWLNVGSDTNDSKRCLKHSSKHPFFFKLQIISHINTVMHTVYCMYRLS